MPGVFEAAYGFEQALHVPVGSLQDWVFARDREGVTPALDGSGCP